MGEYMEGRIPEVHGEIFGLDFDWSKNAAAPLPLVRLCGEDDGNWFYTGETFSIAWLEDLRDTINKAIALRDAGLLKAPR